MDFEWEIFQQALFKSIINIDGKHFIITTFNREKQDYRERVYCYELYHQLRLRLGDFYPYELFGEHNKSGILQVCAEFGDRIAPDFLVHISGGKNNFVVIEVKTVDGIYQHSGEDVVKDIKKLKCFLSNGYRYAILLVYGYYKPTEIKDYLTKLFIDNDLDVSRINVLLNYDLGKFTYL